MRRLADLALTLAALVGLAGLYAAFTVYAAVVDLLRRLK